jgi:pSer/pThr/pTyr-binding forkhead associated (FHA) protein
MGVVMKKWTIGNRQRRNVDLALDDTTVSGLHAILTSTDDGKWIVEDCNSTNGTARFDSGQWQRIRRVYVRPDDRLRFGRIETSVRHLLAAPRDTPQPKRAAAVPWTQDLIAGFKAALSPAEAQKNLLFLPNLIGWPSKHILQCAYHHHPVNPFCFMIFFGLFLNTVITGHVTIGDFTGGDSASTGGNSASPANHLLQAVPVTLVFLPLIAIITVSGYCVFRYFAPQRRRFDDFMRMTGVQIGMTLMLLAVLLLLANPVYTHALQIGEYQKKNDEQLIRLGFEVIILYVTAVTTFIYMVVFNIIAYKHFWDISYPKAVLCSALTGLVVVMAFAVMALPLILPNL